MTRHCTHLMYSAWVAAIAFACVAPIRAQLNTNGLLALWLCDEGAGDTVADASGTGMQAELRDGGGKWVDGKHGGGIAFEGAGWADTATPVVVDTRGFAIGCWVKPGATQKLWANIISSHQEPPQRGLSFEQNMEQLNAYYVIMGGANQWLPCGALTYLSGYPERAFALATDEWQHIVAVRSDDGRTLQPYLNGEALAVDTACESDAPLEAATSNFRLGNYVLGSREWNGAIDEAFVFNRALTDHEVRSLYADG